MRFVLTIKEKHVGQSFIKSPIGERVNVGDFMGLIQPRDVGKRIYETRGVYQVENDSQRNQREEAAEAALRS